MIEVTATQLLADLEGARFPVLDNGPVSAKMAGGFEGFSIIGELGGQGAIVQTMREAMPEPEVLSADNSVITPDIDVPVYTNNDNGPSLG